MATEKKHYWLGKGVINFKGDDYGYGQVLPSGFPKKKIDELKKNGLVGDLPEIIDVEKSIVTALKKENTDLKSKVVSLKAKIEELESRVEGKKDGA